ncbi:hypothetical protein FBEOM_860 [Fusarium beomiforme]|uniref:Uncharacterized protein n=1 Tax=Fusarium beomiforme TaxID=44412 RepID=A0A9P5AUT3_9HYPO|nr:hypothetical protein FBEOM_860 [Fusarium beomiforme]
MPLDRVSKSVKKLFKGNTDTNHSDLSSPVPEAEPAGIEERPIVRDPCTSPEFQSDFIAHLRDLYPETIALFDAAIEENTHMIGVQGFGEMVQGPKSCLDWFAGEVRGENPFRIKEDRTLVEVPGEHVQYLVRKAKGRKREKLEKEIADLQKTADKKYPLPIRPIVSFVTLCKIVNREERIVKLQL